MSAGIPTEQRQAIFDDWQIRAETVVSCTEPLYARNREGRVELRGTGVLMRYGSLYALVSAAHVFDSGGECWVAGEHSRVSLSGVFRTGTNPNVPPPLKEVDLGRPSFPARGRCLA